MRVTQAMALGGPGVKAAGQQALRGTPDDQRAFLLAGQFDAQEDDDAIRVTQIMTVGGPEVRRAAQRALAGTAEDIHYFLLYGYETAAARGNHPAQ